MLFLGTFDYAMDERGRVPLPPRYRDAFRDGIVLSQGSPDGCLRLYTKEAFDKEAANITAEPSLSKRGRELRFSFFSRSHDVELDKQHRILIPAPLRTYASLTGTVLFVGAGEWLEIWTPERYDERLSKVDEQLETMMEAATEQR